MLPRRLGIYASCFRFRRGCWIEAGGQIDSAEGSLAGMVASFFIAASGAQSQPRALQKPMVGRLRHSILMRGWAINCCR
jgi:hypothetical protein